MNGRVDKAWALLLRGLAVVGFVACLVMGFEGIPAWFGFLLIGLFFGPEVIKGQINLNTKDRPKEDGKP